MSTTAKLGLDSGGKDINETLYRSMIDSLLYLTASCPDIVYNVGICARCQSKPKESHVRTIKRILKYISGTIDYGIWLSKDTNTTIVGFSNVD